MEENFGSILTTWGELGVGPGCRGGEGLGGESEEMEGMGIYIERGLGCSAVVTAILTC